MNSKNGGIGRTMNKGLVNLLPQITQLYYKDELPTKQIALTLGISKTNVKRILKKAGYRLRTPSEALKLAYREGRATPPTYPKSDTHKARLSTAQKQYLSEHPHQFSGKHHTEVAKKKMTLARLEKHPSPETREKMSKINKARFANPKNCPMYGKHPTQETRREMALAHLGRVPSSETRQRMSDARKLLWQNPEYRAKVVPACLKSRRPTDLEARLIALIDKYSLPYKYTGDGTFTIGNLNPDFVNVNSEKIAIEVFGGHWHQNRREPLRTEETRRTIAREYGWKLIVIWGDELKSLSEKAILEKIKGGE